MQRANSSQATASKFSSSFIQHWSRCDFFGQKVQGFNHKGETMVTSGLGTILSMIIAIVALIYTVSKAHHVQQVNG